MERVDFFVMVAVLFDLYMKTGQNYIGSKLNVMVGFEFYAGTG